MKELEDLMQEIAFSKRGSHETKRAFLEFIIKFSKENAIQLEPVPTEQEPQEQLSFDFDKVA